LYLGAVIASVRISLKEAVMGALRDRMIEEMKLRSFSAATQKTYVYAVRRLAKYYGKKELRKRNLKLLNTHCDRSIHFKHPGRSGKN
jgi:integrase-like protein